MPGRPPRKWICLSPSSPGKSIAPAWSAAGSPGSQHLEGRLPQCGARRRRGAGEHRKKAAAGKRSLQKNPPQASTEGTAMTPPRGGRPRLKPRHPNAAPNPTLEPAGFFGDTSYRRHAVPGLESTSHVGENVNCRVVSSCSFFLPVAYSSGWEREITCLLIIVTMGLGTALGLSCFGQRLASKSDASGISTATWSRTQGHAAHRDRRNAGRGSRSHLRHSADRRPGRRGAPFLRGTSSTCPTACPPNGGGSFHTTSTPSSWT